MLETKNLKKVYKTKKGVAVEALKGVSIKFAEKGMVFLLGKSGSGKSTLLNLLGGLDKYDNGEIIIKGVSSKDFKQNHFDSYRNTYVGFIFQEYNILEEFSVGANIALAIELQGRKATDNEINDILEKVDLVGFGDRKPNELSGGQKQRVAIARALFKNPQIIMADEPTGALDSNTGKQVFDTLKKLSKSKLVIVVSHDREFAQEYGDRIIELADGQVMSDVERSGENREDESSAIQYGRDELVIRKGYHLTEADREMINKYLAEATDDVKVKVQSQENKGFVTTDQEKIQIKKDNFKLIKSKLPLKNAFKIGASSLKHKKIRLAITIILSFVAFAMFALADTFGSYNHIKTCTNSIIDTNIKYASASKSKYISNDGNGYWDEASYKLSKEDIEKLSKNTGLDFKGVYPEKDGSIAINNYDKNVELTKNEQASLYSTMFVGYAEITDKDLKKMGYNVVAGRLPQGDKNEMAMSQYMYKLFEKAGYVDNKGNKTEISSPKDMIGKKLQLNKNEYTVVGIIDTKVDIDRYKKIIEDPTGKSSAERLTNFALSQELDSISNYSFASVIMVGSGHLEKIKACQSTSIPMDQFNMDFYVNDYEYEVSASAIEKLGNADKSKITWVNGAKTRLGKKEVIVSANSFAHRDTSMSKKEILKYLKDNPTFTWDCFKNNSTTQKEEDGWKIVGIIDADEDIYILPDDIYNQDWNDDAGEYIYAVSSMPSKRADIEKLVKYCYKTNKNVRYQLQNSVTFELDTVNETLAVFAKVFLYLGIGFAVFAAIMLSNFIATSISYKKQEIGILRAIGARSNDVFKIFFSESFIIAVVNFLLAAVASGAATIFINTLFRKNVGILITILNFGIRQILLLFVISIAVVAIASFIPVYKIASKRPIEAIRNK